MVRQSCQFYSVTSGYNKWRRRTLEQVSEFNSQTDQSNTYIKQLELFYEACDISEDSKKRTILLSPGETVT